MSAGILTGCLYYSPGCEISGVKLSESHQKQALQPPAALKCSLGSVGLAVLSCPFALILGAGTSAGGTVKASLPPPRGGGWPSSALGSLSLQISLGGQGLWWGDRHLADAIESQRK